MGSQATSTAYTAFTGEDFLFELKAQTKGEGNIHFSFIILLSCVLNIGLFFGGSWRLFTIKKETSNSKVNKILNFGFKGFLIGSEGKLLPGEKGRNLPGKGQGKIKQEAKNF